jgi:hypothetical protein
MDGRILYGKEAFEMSVPPLGIWTEGVVDEVASVRLTRRLRLEFPFYMLQRAQSIQDVEPKMLPDLLHAKWAPIFFINCTLFASAC